MSKRIGLFIIISSICVLSTLIFNEYSFAAKNNGLQIEFEVLDEEGHEAKEVMVGEVIVINVNIINNYGEKLENCRLVSDSVIQDRYMNIGTIEDKENTGFVFYHKISQAEMDKGKIDISMEILGVNSYSEVIKTIGTTSLKSRVIPSIELQVEMKTQDGNPVSDFVADKIYMIDYEVINTGNITIREMLATEYETDRRLRLNKNIIAPGESTTGTFLFKPTQKDIDNGSITKRIEVFGVHSISETIEVDESVKIDARLEPSIKMELVALDRSGRKIEEIEPGEMVMLSFRLLNTGNVTLSEIYFDNKQFKDLKIINPDKTLAPGKSVTSELAYVISQDDLDLGGLYVAASVTANDPKGNKVGSVGILGINVEQTPKLELALFTDTNKVTTEEDTVFSYVVTNKGNVTLSNISLSSSMFGEVNINNQTLAPGAVSSGKVRYRGSFDDMDIGSVLEIARVEARTAIGDEVESSSWIEVRSERNSEITMERLFDKSEASLNEKVEFTYRIKNIGNTTISEIEVSDANFPSGVKLDKTTLKPGETITGVFSYRVKHEDVIRGNLLSEASVSGQTPDDKDVSYSLSDLPKFSLSGGIRLQIESDDKDVELDDTISYKYTVTNTSDDVLSEITLVDSMSKEKTYFENLSLRPGESKIVNRNYVVTQSDVDSGEVINIVRIDSVTANGNKRDNSEWFSVECLSEPNIDLNIRVLSQNHFIGENAECEITVENTGNVTIEKLLIIDNINGAVLLEHKTELGLSEEETVIAYVPIHNELVTNDEYILNFSVRAVDASGIEIHRTSESIISVLSGLISGHLYTDENLSFTYDIEDTPIESLEIILSSDKDEWRTTTNRDGYYEFSNIEKGYYVLSIQDENTSIGKSTNRISGSSVEYRISDDKYKYGMENISILIQ